MAAVLACGRSTAGVRDMVRDRGATRGYRGDADGPPPTLDSQPILDHWGAALSHRSAAALWRLLPRGQEPVYVSVTGVEGKSQREHLHVHRSRTLTPGEVTSHEGIPVTTPVCTIADLRRAASTRGCPAAMSRRELRQAIRQAEVLGLPTEAEAITERSRSDLEIAFLGLCRQHGLRKPEVNEWIGSLQIDFLWRTSRLAVETDGYRYHRGRLAFETDRERDLRLRALGYEVIRLSERQVEEEPETIAEVLGDLLEAQVETRNARHVTGKSVGQWQTGSPRA